MTKSTQQSDRAQRPDGAPSGDAAVGQGDGITGDSSDDPGPQGSSSGLSSEILIDWSGWIEVPDCEALIAAGLARAWLEYLALPEADRPATAIAPHQAADVTVVLSSDDEVGRLNSAYRGKPAPTNVLSFPTDPDGLPPEGLESYPLGDIIIAYETAAREAEGLDRDLAGYTSHLAVHGFLHLLGYDHADDAQAAQMEGLETRIALALGLPDPYGEP